MRRKRGKSLMIDEVKEVSFKENESSAVVWGFCTNGVVVCGGGGGGVSWRKGHVFTWQW
jgi:hypothetical protein